MTSENKRTVTALVWILLLTFAGLCTTSYFLYDQTMKVRALNSQKRVLIDQLADEVLARQRFKKQMDSLLNLNHQLQTTVTDSVMPKAENQSLKMANAGL